MARLLQTLPLLVSVTSGQDSESYTYTSKDFKVLNFCVAYTKCIATLWHHLIYLFVCPRESIASHVVSCRGHFACVVSSNFLGDRFES